MSWTVTEMNKNHGTRRVIGVFPQGYQRAKAAATTRAASDKAEQLSYLLHYFPDDELLAEQPIVHEVVSRSNGVVTVERGQA